MDEKPRGPKKSGLMSARFWYLALGCCLEWLYYLFDCGEKADGEWTDEMRDRRRRRRRRRQTEDEEAFACKRCSDDDDDDDGNGRSSDRTAKDDQDGSIKHNAEFAYRDESDKVAVKFSSWTPPNDAVQAFSDDHDRDDDHRDAFAVDRAGCSQRQNETRRIGLLEDESEREEDDKTLEEEEKEHGDRERDRDEDDDDDNDEDDDDDDDRRDRHRVERGRREERAPGQLPDIVVVVDAAVGSSTDFSRHTGVAPCLLPDVVSDLL